MEILIKKVPSLASISKFFKPENESWLENFKSVFAKAFNSIKFFGTFSTILIFVFDKFSTVENLYTTKEEKTKLTLAQINNVNLNSIIEPGFYVSVKWDNNISGLPTELNNNEGRAFYLVVFALDSTNSYCQQVLYSFKGLIFYRAITDTNSTFTQWRRINLI